jgi:hydroxymethylpyrimidine/phosphomethylpyrimidine kinase
MRAAGPARSKKFVAMAIAGSDPGGGAGFQADLKTFAALQVYGFSVITEVIAQNSTRVARVSPIEADLVAAQIETLVEERRPDAIKTGALASASVVKAVAEAIRTLHLPAPVIDPVLISTSGVRLLDLDGEQALRTDLMALARIVTPNIPEAELLSGMTIDGPSSLRAAARVIHNLGAPAVVVKGGHLFHGDTDSRKANQAVDLFYDGRDFVEFAGPRVQGEGAHGTGCAFSAAIAAYLARGADLETALRRAKSFVTRALRHSFTLGGGRALLDHFARR